MPWKRERGWADSPCSGRTDSTYDSEPDLSSLSLDVDGNCCSSLPIRIVSAATFASTSRFSPMAGSLEACLSRTAWLTVRLRSRYPFEAGISCCLKRGEERNKPFRLHEMLQQLMFTREWCSAGLAQEVRFAGSKHWCGGRASPLGPHSAFWKNLGTSCDVEGDVEMLWCAILSSKDKPLFHARSLLNKLLSQPTAGWLDTWLCRQYPCTSPLLAWCGG